MDQALENIISLYKNQGLLTGSRLSNSILFSFTQYMRSAVQDTALAFINTDAFGKGKKGLLITNKGIYWRNGSLWSSFKKAMTWEQLLSVKKQIRCNGRNLEIMPNSHLEMSGCLLSNEALRSLLKSLIKLYKSDPECFTPDESSSTIAARVQTLQEAWQEKQALQNKDKPNPVNHEERGKSILKGLGYCILGFIALTIYALSTAPKKINTSKFKANNHVTPISAMKWYEGGTLKNANSQAWLNATPINRLATSNDLFLIYARKLQPELIDDLPDGRFMSGLKAYATSMESCITHYAYDEQITQKVHRIAVQCFIDEYR